MKKITKNKLLLFLIIITIISILLGIFFIAVISNDNQELVKSTINSYFLDINENKIKYFKNLWSILTSNLFLILFIWIMGISIIGIIISLILLIYKSFLIGFSFTSILYTYGFKGLISGIIYIFPEIINLFIVFVLTYYSISFSILLFNYLFKKKEYNRIFVRRYLKLLVISSLIIIFSTLISTFIIPNLLRII
ncbi:MAG: stage II sporulation protein M [Bacilli bacterium]|nr:stage II sporulation protein M [Bacilli bacterium]